MEWRNPAYNAFGTIDCEINHPIYGWIPFTARPGDTGAEFDVDELLTDIDRAGNIAPYQPPTVEQLRALMAPLTRRQLFIALASEGYLTEQEAEDAAAGNAIPASILAVFDALVLAGSWTTADRIAAKITFRSFTTAPRLDPMVGIIKAASNPAPTDEQLDTMWSTYVLV